MTKNNTYKLLYQIFFYKKKKAKGFKLNNLCYFFKFKDLSVFFWNLRRATHVWRLFISAHFLPIPPFPRKSKAISFKSWLNCLKDIWLVLHRWLDISFSKNNFIHRLFRNVCVVKKILSKNKKTLCVHAIK
jgi:hypothetical protein